MLLGYLFAPSLVPTVACNTSCSPHCCHCCVLGLLSTLARVAVDRSHLCMVVSNADGQRCVAVPTAEKLQETKHAWNNDEFYHTVLDLPAAMTQPIYGTALPALGYCYYYAIHRQLHKLVVAVMSSPTGSFELVRPLRPFSALTSALLLAHSFSSLAMGLQRCCVLGTYYLWFAEP